MSQATGQRRAPVGVALPVVTDFASTLARLEPIGRVFRDAGHELHLVGGMVRDVLLGLAGEGEDLTGDLDLTTDARPDQSRALLEPLASVIWDQGARFGTIGAKVGEALVEVTTYRSESYAPDSRKPEVAFGDDLDVDLSRRDFTINAIAVSVTTGQLHDPFRGRDDLAARRLRTPLAPDVSFVDDPLRMLRAARFLARFDLGADPTLEAAASEHAHRLGIVSTERVREELERLLSVTDPQPGTEFLARHGLAELVVSGIDSSAWQRATTRFSRTPDRDLRRALLFSSFGPEQAKARLDHMRYSRHDTNLTVNLLRLAASARRLQTHDGQPSDASIRRLVASAGVGAEPEIIDQAVSLAAIQDELDRPTPVESALDDLRKRESLTNFDSPLTGGEIMRALGINPGRRVGQAMAHLRELRITQGPLSAADARTALHEAVFDD